MDRKRTFKKRDNTTSKETKTLLVLTYNQPLPNIRKVFCKHWNISSIKKSFKVNLQNKPASVFKYGFQKLSKALKNTTKI